MRMATRYYRRTARFLALSVIVTGVVAITSNFVTPTLSCPMVMPRPLRSLYAQSERIVVAHVGKSETTNRENNDGEDNENNIIPLRTALHVSSTLKGDHQAVVYVSHFGFRDYKDQLSIVADDKTLLVFLNKAPGMDDYQVDMNYGLKELPDADLKIYVSRIEELNSIMNEDKPSDAAIVEWLVRCAEEPATRWEGAYELAMSKYLRQAENERPDENGPLDSSTETSQIDAAETPVDEISLNEDEVQNVRVREGAPTKAIFLDLLTTQQKHRLTTALTDIEIITARDLVLVDVVQTWNDPRFLPYLLAQLDLMSRPGKSEDMPYYITENIMTTVADELGDDALKAMVKRLSIWDYEQTETYYDEEESSEDNEEVEEVSEEQQAADEAATAQRRRAELQHFVTLALSTVPKTPTEEPANPVNSTEP